MHRKILEDSRGLLAGVSGGRDSMALLHTLKPFYAKLQVAHINYQTRDNSYKEESLVKEYCAQRGLPCHVLRAEGCSLTMPNFEAYARKVRYDFYQKTAQICGADVLVLGQHQSDVAETVLLRLLRGSSRLYMKSVRTLPSGLTLVRPLLDKSREEITALCQKEGVPWREDESNESLFFLRNFLRHKILPPLKNKVPFLEQRLALSARLREEEENFIHSHTLKARHALGSSPTPADFLALPSLLRRRLLALWFEEQGLPAPGYKLHAEIERKIQNASGGITLHQQEGKRFALKGGRLRWLS